MHPKPSVGVASPQHVLVPAVIFEEVWPSAHVPNACSVSGSFRRVGRRPEGLAAARHLLHCLIEIGRPGAGQSASPPLLVSDELRRQRNCSIVSPDAYNREAGCSSAHRGAVNTGEVCTRKQLPGANGGDRRVRLLRCTRWKVSVPLGWGPWPGCSSDVTLPIVISSATKGGLISVRGRDQRRRSVYVVSPTGRDISSTPRAPDVPRRAARPRRSFISPRGRVPRRNRTWIQRVNASESFAAYRLHR